MLPARCCRAVSIIERPLAGFRRNLATRLITATPASMGVYYAYDLASTLYNDAEQRPSLVKKGLTRAGIEKV